VKLHAFYGRPCPLIRFNPMTKSPSSDYKGRYKDDTGPNEGIGRNAEVNRTDLAVSSDCSRAVSERKEHFRLNSLLFAHSVQMTLPE
jgi:hypothetical protein